MQHTQIISADCPPLLLHLLTSLWSSTETGKQHTALLISALPRHGTSRGANRAASVPCAHHLVMSGSTPGPARPMQSRARQCLVPAGGHWTIRHGLLGGVTKCFSLFSGVTPTADLCVSLLLAMSNHSPAVQFIWTASVIPVKCSA